MLKGSGYDRVVMVVPSFHRRRAVGQFEAWGVRINKVYNAEKVYVNDPNITKSTRKRRKRMVRKIYWSPQMIAERIKELSLNVIGLADRAGMLSRYITSKTRGRQKVN